MEQDNLIIYVSSRNNYDMLEGEVLKNIDREGFEFINVDDQSSEEEIIKGKNICSKHGVTFLENKSRGVQMATQTLIDFINKNRPNCKWIICFQHDNYPISSEFFTKISSLISQGKLKNYGILGFNNLDHGNYTRNSLTQFKNGGFPLGMIGMAHLSIHDRESRWLCPARQNKLLQNPLWNKPFIVEFPMWASVGINIELWNTCITPTTDYQFHLWLPDIAMQFNYKNYPCLVLPDLYCLNHQALKTKYGINANSAQGAKTGNEYHFGKFSNFDAWLSRWGWYYEDIVNTFEQVKHNYEGTLIKDFYDHDITTGPLRSIIL
jgi:hypothetical protein